MDIVIVDDHEIFRQSLMFLLDTQANIKVIGHFGSISQLLECNKTLTPNCVLLDYHLPDENPLQILEPLGERFPNAQRVFLTGTRSAAVLQRIIAAPVHGVIHKSENAKTILEIINALPAAEKILSPAIMDLVEDIDFGLTTKEFDVLALLTQGLNPTQIAEQMYVSRRTVEKHKENMMRKTGSRNLAQLIELGHRMLMVESL